MAQCLWLNEDVIDELSEKGTPATQSSATVCVLCDALYEAGLQSVADMHFKPDVYTDRILRPPPVPVPVPESTSTTSAAIQKDEACSI